MRIIRTNNNCSTWGNKIKENRTIYIAFGSKLISLDVPTNYLVVYLSIFTTWIPWFSLTENKRIYRMIFPIRHLLSDLWQFTKKIWKQQNHCEKRTDWATFAWNLLSPVNYTYTYSILDTLRVLNYTALWVDSLYSFYGVCGLRVNVRVKYSE